MITNPLPVPSDRTATYHAAAERLRSANRPSAMQLEVERSRQVANVRRRGRFAAATVLAVLSALSVMSLSDDLVQLTLPALLLVAATVGLCTRRLLDTLTGATSLLLLALATATLLPRWANPSLSWFDLTGWVVVCMYCVLVTDSALHALMERTEAGFDRVTSSQGAWINAIAQREPDFAEIVDGWTMAHAPIVQNDYHALRALERLARNEASPRSPALEV